MSVKVGDIFYDSWGYDQTNIDFVKVIRVSSSGKTVICRMMSKDRINESTVRPDKEWGVEFRLHVRQRQNQEPYLRGKYPFVQSLALVHFREDGYFWKYTHPVYETPVGMGH